MGDFDYRAGATDIGSSYIAARSHQSVNSAPERRTEKSANQAIQNPQKQIVSCHGRVPPNDTGSVAQCSAAPISTGARVSKLSYGELVILVSGHDGLRTLDAPNRLI
jgi:hypothetical protein